MYGSLLTHWALAEDFKKRAFFFFFSFSLPLSLFFFFLHSGKLCFMVLARLRNIMFIREKTHIVSQLSVSCDWSVARAPMGTGKVYEDLQVEDMSKGRLQRTPIIAPYTAQRSPKHSVSLAFLWRDLILPVMLPLLIKSEQSRSLRTRSTPRAVVHTFRNPRDFSPREAE